MTLVKVSYGVSFMRFQRHSTVPPLYLSPLKLRRSHTMTASTRTWLHTDTAQEGLTRFYCPPGFSGYRLNPLCAAFISGNIKYFPFLSLLTTDIAQALETLFCGRQGSSYLAINQSRSLLLMAWQRNWLLALPGQQQQYYWHSYPKIFQLHHFKD